MITLFDVTAGNVYVNEDWTPTGYEDAFTKLADALERLPRWRAGRVRLGLGP